MANAASAAMDASPAPVREASPSVRADSSISTAVSAPSRASEGIASAASPERAASTQAATVMAAVAEEATRSMVTEASARRA